MLLCNVSKDKDWNCDLTMSSEEETKLVPLFLPSPHIHTAYALERSNLFHSALSNKAFLVFHAVFPRTNFTVCSQDKEKKKDNHKKGNIRKTKPSTIKPLLGYFKFYRCFHLEGHCNLQKGFWPIKSVCCLKYAAKPGI